MMNFTTRRRGGGAAKTAQGELKIIPLGGLGEIGKNLTVFRWNNDIIIVDCGLKFPDETMLGIDFVIPDVQYLIENRKNIKGIFITHGHEDHIGALPLVLPLLNVPVYCTRLTVGLIKNKLDEVCPDYQPKFREIARGAKVKAGSFDIEFISVCHSIPDALALAIGTPLGTIVHTGDYKLDPTPIDGVRTDFAKFARLGEEGVLMLMSDSTNVERDGVTPSEKTVGQTFERLFRLHKDKRIIIAAFASNLHRIQQVLNVAARFNRKVMLVGRSMLANVELAAELGCIKLPNDEIIVSPEEAALLSDNRLVILTTGSQGEPFSGLVLMSRGMHKTIKMGEKDLVIISANPIPGNEKLVSQTIDRLMSYGCDVIYGKEEKTHVSGHASRDELTIMLSLVNPQFFMPVHGEFRHLTRHAQLARELGVQQKNIFILENGDVLTFKTGKKALIDGKVPAGSVLVDGKALGEFEGSLLRERRELSENGIVVVSVVIDKKGNVKAPVQIKTKGSVITSDDESMEVLERAVRRTVEQFARTPGAKPETLPTEIRKRIREMCGQSPRNYPTIIPLITTLK